MDTAAFISKLAFLAYLSTTIVNACQYKNYYYSDYYNYSSENFTDPPLNSI